MELSGSSESPYRPAVRPGTWIRSREPWNHVGAVMGVFYGLVLGYVLVHAWVTRWSASSVGASVPLLAFVAIFAGVPVLLSVRALRAAIRIDPSGVTVRGLTKTISLPLSEVEGFVPRRVGMGAVRSTVGVMMRRRGRPDFRVFALRHGEFSDRDSQERAIERWRPLCEELFDLVRSLRREGETGAR